MQVVIRFDRNIETKKELLSVILEEIKKFKRPYRVIGPLNGFSISPISWNDGLTLAARISILVRNHGVNAIDEIEIRVEKEQCPSEISTFYNEWRGH